MPKLPKVEMADLDAMASEYRRFSEFVGKSKKLQKEQEMVRMFIAPSHRDVVYREHSVTLYRYKRRKKASHRLPLFIVPSLVNKPFIMDMLKGESFVEAMLDRGFDVFIIEWGIPTPGQKHLPLEHYIKHYMNRASKRILKMTGAPGLSVAGYCIGGNLALLHAACDKGERVKNLITMVTPINFEDKGMLSWWAKKEHFDIDKVVDTYGNIPADFFSQAFPWLVPQANLVKMRTIYEKHEDKEFMRSFLALDIWGKENTSFPGEVYRSIIKHGYQENVLVEQGEWPLEEGCARLADIEMPCLNMAAQYDHIAPCDSCLVSPDLLPNADCTSKAYATGHLGIALGKDVMQQPTTEYWDEIAQWLEKND